MGNGDAGVLAGGTFGHEFGARLLNRGAIARVLTQVDSDVFVFAVVDRHFQDLCLEERLRRLRTQLDEGLARRLRAWRRT